MKMRLLGCLAVFLCTILICSSQESSTTTTHDSSTPVTSLPTTTPPPTQPSSSATSPSTAAPPVTTPTTAVPPVTTPTTAVPPVTTPTTAVPPVTSPTTAVPPVTTPTTAVPPVTTPTTAVPPVTTPTTTVPPVTTPTTAVPPVTTPTTATPPESTSAAPTTEAPNHDLHFSVNDTTVVCILANMDITLKYTFEVNGTSKTDSYFLNKADTSMGGDSSCAAEELSVEFANANNIILKFSNADDKVKVSEVDFISSDIGSLFANTTGPLSLHYNGSIFEASKEKSYFCNAENSIDLLTTNGTKSGMTVVFSKVQVEAFRTKATSDFSATEDCVADDNVSDIVPIAVGCALAGLIVIVLIAYLVGRRQKRQRGYESV